MLINIFFVILTSSKPISQDLYDKRNNRIALAYIRDTTEFSFMAAVLHMFDPVVVESLSSQFNGLLHSNEQLSR